MRGAALLPSLLAPCLQAHWPLNDDKGDWYPAKVRGRDIFGKYTVEYDHLRKRPVQQKVPRSLIRSMKETTNNPGAYDTGLGITSDDRIRIRGLPYMVYRDETLSTYELVEDMSAFRRDAGGSIEQWPFANKAVEGVHKERGTPLWLCENKWNRSALAEIRILTRKMLK